MAEWSHDSYVIHFPEESRREIFYDDPVWKASEILKAFLDMEESGYTEIPLYMVMDTLGYKGDRSGLVDTSCVADIEVHGDSIAFCVKDNFSEFDVCRELAKKLKTDIDVDVVYEYAESTGIGFRSPVEHYRAYDPARLKERIEDKIRETLQKFPAENNQSELSVYAPFNLMRIDSFGPEPDTLNLVLDNNIIANRPDRMTVKLSEIKDVQTLEFLMDRVERNLTTRNKMESVSESKNKASGPSEGTDRGLGIEKEREGLLRSVYGSSEAYQNISEFMKGFDFSYKPGSPRELTAKDAVEVASHAKTIIGTEADLSAEVQDLLERGFFPENALKEWDIDVPTLMSPDMITMYFDNEPFAQYERLDSKNDSMTLTMFNSEVVNYMKESLGRDFPLVLLGDQMKTNEVLSTCKELLTCPKNLEMVSEAKKTTERKARQRSMAKTFKGVKSYSKGLSL